MSSFAEGNAAVAKWVSLLGADYIRHATFHEDVNEHWDVLDQKYGRVDVKAPKRLYRNGPITYTIWWELRTVRRPDGKNYPGWGIDNGIDRLIAMELEDRFLLLSPTTLTPILRYLCTEHGRGDFLCHSRPDRGDCITILPLWFCKEHAVGEILF